MNNIHYIINCKTIEGIPKALSCFEKIGCKFVFEKARRIIHVCDMIDGRPLYDVLLSTNDLIKQDMIGRHDCQIYELNTIEEYLIKKGDIMI